MKSTVCDKLFLITILHLCLFIFSNASITPAPYNTCCDLNTIIVQGESTVSVQPDIALISVSISATQNTSQQAVAEVNDKISQINKILVENSIKSTDISTSNLNVYPQYSYVNGMSQIIGQNAQQFLSIKIKNINSTGGNLGPLIDSLVNVNGIQLNGLSFDKEDKSVAQTQARKQAFNNAKTKANDYASFASRVLGKVITILDGAFYSPLPVPLRDAKVSNMDMASAAPTSIQVGNIDISYNMQVTFALR